MVYRYEFDPTSPGDFGLPLRNYRIVQEAILLLCKELELWNQRTLDDGGMLSPYEKEVTDLKQLINWGDGQLDQPKAHEIVIRGISVGNLRYIKAALMFLIQGREQEHAKKVEDGWPSAVLQSFTDAIEQVRTLARSIDREPNDILWEIVPKEPVAPRTEVIQQAEWDVFVCHASEDKDAFARPLAKGLQSHGFKVWFDEFTLSVGDGLRRSIDRGLARSKFGIVVISPNFLRKNWPQRELDGLVAREVTGEAKVILPVWHEIDAKQIGAYSLTLADRVAISSSEGLDYVIAKLERAMRPEETATPVQTGKAEVSEGRSNSDVVDRLEEYLVNDADRIKLYNLVFDETERVHARLTDTQFPVMGLSFDVSQIAARLEEYESLTEPLRTIVLTGCRWGKAKHATYWAQCLTRIANSTTQHLAGR